MTFLGGDLNPEFFNKTGAKHVLLVQIPEKYVAIFRVIINSLSAFDQELIPSQNDLETLSLQTNEDLESNQEQGQEVPALKANNQVVQGNLLRGIVNCLGVA